MSGLKYDNDKPRLELIDPLFMEELGRVLAFGARKYASENWRQGIDYTRIIASLKRHTLAFEKGENLDSETGLSHVVHAACNCMFLYWYTLNRAEFDNRYYKPTTKYFDELAKESQERGEYEQEQDGPVVIEGPNTGAEAYESVTVDCGYGRIKKY